MNAPALPAGELLAAARAGDSQACEQVLRENNGLIWSVVRRYYGRGVEPDDLYQLGCLGFLKAVRGFDPDYGTQFSTYAVPKIAGEIRRFLRDDGPVKVSRGPGWAGSPPSASCRRRRDWSRRTSPRRRRRQSLCCPSRARRGREG